MTSTVYNIYKKLIIKIVQVFRIKSNKLINNKIINSSTFKMCLVSSPLASIYDAFRHLITPNQLIFIFVYILHLINIIFYINLYSEIIAL